MKTRRFNPPALSMLRGGPVFEENPQTIEDMGKTLVNSGLFDWALEDIPDLGIKRIDDRHAPRLAMLLWNQLRFGTREREAGKFGIEAVATEDIQTTDLALPTKWALPIIRRIYPAIFDSPLFATQTMPGPLAYAFYLDFKREADGSDFRAVNPFTGYLNAVVAAAATSVTLQGSSKANSVGMGPYQFVQGQIITLGLGTANVENVTINGAPTVANGVTTLPITATTKTHAVGDVVYAAAVSALNEIAVPTKAKLSLTRTPVTANKWMMAATWSTEAMEDARAQLNLDIEGEMVQALAVEIGRELFGTIIGDILQQATGGTATIPAKGGTSPTDYKTLVPQSIYDLEAKVYSRRFHDTDTLLCGVDLAANIAEQDTFHIAPADANNTLAQLGVTHLGTFQGKFQLYKTIFLPPNLGILFNQPRDWLHAGYVYMPYIPLSPMPLVYAGFNSSTGNYQNTDEWTRNIRTRAGRLMTISDEFALLTQA